MRKNSKNKKNKKNKSNSMTKKEEVIPQEDGISTINNEVSDDKESRRSTRLGTIIAIVAVLGTICTVLFKITRGIINEWPESGYIYYIYIWGLFIASLAAAVMMFLEIIWFVVGDLKRYNLLNENYTQYDSLSDERYYRLVTDFKIFTMGLLVLLMLLIPVSLLWSDTPPQKYLYFAATVMLGGIGIFGVVEGVKKRKICINKMKKIVYTVGVWLLMSLLVFIFMLTVIQGNTAIVNVDFGKDGKVLITNESAENFESLKIFIYDSLDNIVSEDDILKSDLLFAKETKHVSTEYDNGKEIGKAQVIDGETLYWKYQFKLNDLKLITGRYCIWIVIQQDGRSVEIINMFEVNNYNYIYGTDSISKNY